METDEKKKIEDGVTSHVLTGKKNDMWNILSRS